MKYDDALQRCDELMTKQLGDPRTPLPGTEQLEYDYLCRRLREHRVEHYQYLLETLETVVGQLEDTNPLPDSLAAKLVDDIVDVIGDVEDIA